MRVVLYSSHHCLPFWDRPRNPDLEVFESDLTSKLLTSEWFDETGPFPEDSWIRGVLGGLLMNPRDNLLANVSLHASRQSGSFAIYPTKRVWVQITTLPLDSDGTLMTVSKSGVSLPEVIHKESLQVLHLWGGKNGAHAPGPFAEVPQDTLKNAADWCDFFESHLVRVLLSILHIAKYRRDELQQGIDCKRRLLGQMNHQLKDLE